MAKCIVELRITEIICAVLRKEVLLQENKSQEQAERNGRKMDNS